MPTLLPLTKDQYIPFLDTAKDLTHANPVYKRVDKSTTFELSINEQTEDKEYICDKNATTEIIANKPTLPLEIVTEEGNDIHDFIANEFYNMPIGSQAQTGCLICFGGSAKRAWRGIVTITSKVLNTVDRKYTFEINWAGDVEKGTYSITGGVPTFIPPVPANKVKAEKKED